MTSNTRTDRPQTRWTGQAAAAPGPLNMDGMYLMHHALRRDFARLAAAFRTVSLSDRKRLAGLRKHVAFLLHELHLHHTGEDELIYPALRRIAPDEHVLLDAMAAEHGGMDAAVEAAEAAADALVAAPTEATRATAVRAIDEVADAVGA